MKKTSKVKPQTKPDLEPVLTVGLDLGDRYIHYCMLNEVREVIDEGRMKMTEEALGQRFAALSRMRIALEAGTHSAWVSRLLRKFGHQVIVANPRKLRAITASESKNDRNDAEKLARFAAQDPKLLSPIEHRSEQRQLDLNLIKARATLVRARTMLINALRGLVKSAGGRLPSCSTECFQQRARPAIPASLVEVCVPLLTQIGALKLRIDELDKHIGKLDKKYPEIKLLRTVPGVGPVVASCYVLTLDRPEAMKSNRQAGAFLGLRPRQSQSGDSDPQRRITKTGNTYLRSLLVQSAQYILGRFAPDSALRRWGLKLAASGGKRGKKRAIVAVARKLAVILHSMWRNKQVFQPSVEPAVTAA
jgi:transposase